MTSLIDPTATDLRKPHSLLVMAPEKKMSLLARKLYLLLMQHAQESMADAGAMPPANHLFSAPAPSLLRMTGTGADRLTAAKGYLRELRRQSASYSDASADGGSVWRDFALLSEVRLDSKAGSPTTVSWAFPPTVMEALFNPDRWVSLDMQIVASLMSYEAVALYEICARYSTSPGGVTSRHPPDWWLKALSSKPDSKRDWRKFKSERLKPALAELNLTSDLEIDLIEHRQGKTLVEVQFSVKRRRSLPRVQLKPVDVGFAQDAQAAGVPESAIESLIRDFDDETLRAGMARLKRKIGDTADPVRDPAKYLRRICNDFKSALELKPVADAVAPVVGQVTEPAPSRSAGEEIKARHAVEHAEASKTFEALTPDEQAEYIAEVLGSPDLPDALKVLAGRHQPGARLSPVLRAHVINRWKGRAAA